MKKNFKVLICPLEWGIGHATRCVPVIREFLAQDFEVVIAADNLPLRFLQEAFPELQTIRFSGYPVRYSSGKGMVRKMLLSIPRIVNGIRKEHRELKRIIKEYGIDLVVSDNRFGLWTDQVPCIYLTHQVMIKAPGNMKWAEPVLYWIHRWIIRRYDQCWIPDLPGKPNLSGDLSHRMPLPENCSYIGPLSRFQHMDTEAAGNHNRQKHFSYLFMLSGPEPQRSLLEEKILKELATHPAESVILRGLPGNADIPAVPSCVKIFNHLRDEQIVKYLKEAEMVISRPGYSTVMDMVALNRKAHFIPTPGQTEQEYLAGYLNDCGYFGFTRQDEFSLDKTGISSSAFHPPEGLFNLPLLRQQIVNLKSTL